MQRVFKQFSRVFLIISIIFALTIPAFAETKMEAVSIVVTQLDGEGGVLVDKMGRELELKVGMRVVSGSTITTDATTVAHLSLDSKSVLTIGKSSEVDIEKKGSKNDIYLVSGEVAVNVSEKLEGSEELNIATSNMVMGVRGTVASMSKRENEDGNGNVTKGVLYRGVIEIDTAEGTEKLDAGNMVIIGERQLADGDGVDISQEIIPLTKEAIDPTAAVLMTQNEELLREVSTILGEDEEDVKNAVDEVLETDSTQRLTEIETQGAAKDEADDSSRTQYVAPSTDHITDDDNITDETTDTTPPVDPPVDPPVNPPVDPPVNPPVVHGNYSIDDGEVTIEPSATGSGYKATQGSEVREIPQGTQFSFTGTASNGIIIKDGISAMNMVIENLNITKNDGAAIDIQGDSSITIQIEGTNVLTSGSDSAGIQINASTTSGAIPSVAFSGTGTLTVNGGSNGAGIGGSKASGGGNVTINSGTITANGGSNGAGIGGGDGCSSGVVTITGGTVTANGESNAAGIGGGNNGSNTTVNISGGTVTSAGGSNGSGIGGGNGGSGGTITISGGTVNVFAGGNAAGIGGGNGGSGATTSISGGVVMIIAMDATAIGGSSGSAHGSFNTGSSGKAIIMMQTKATSPIGDTANMSSWSGYMASDVNAFDSKIYGSTTFTVTQSFKTSSAAGFPTITINSGETLIVDGATIDNATTAAIINNGEIKYINGGTITGAVSPNAPVTITALPAGGITTNATDNIVISNIDAANFLVTQGANQYVFAKNESLKISGNGQTEKQIIVSDGVTDVNIEISDVNIFPHSTAGVTESRTTVSAFDIQGSSSVNLTITGDNILNSTTYHASSDRKSALSVPAGATVIISGSGTLTAQGGYNASGIGFSDGNTTAGTITINSGTIVAKGGRDSAGIGGGSGAGSGIITINGGTVSAYGNKSAAGIGYGWIPGDSGSIAIIGGTVNAYGGMENGSGLGAVVPTDEFGEISITGGTVNIVSNSSEIGSGYEYDGSSETYTQSTSGYVMGGQGSQITIGNGATFTVKSGQNFHVSTENVDLSIKTVLTIENGAQLIIESGGALIVEETATVNVNSGAVINNTAGVIRNSGTITRTGGTIIDITDNNDNIGYEQEATGTIS